MNATLVPDGCSLAPEQSLSNACPSSEWESIRQVLELGSQELPQKYQEIYKIEAESSYFFVSGKDSQRQQYLAITDGAGPYTGNYVSTTQMVATADALSNVGALWLTALNNVTQSSGHGSPLSVQTNSIHTLSGDSFQGFSVGNCFAEAIRNKRNNDSIAFPFLNNANNPATPTINMTTSDKHYTFSAIVHPSLSRADVLNNTRHPFQYQLQWVELPQPPFNGSSIGAVIVPPHAVDDGPQDLIMCNLAAGWGTVALQTDRDQSTRDSSVSSRIIHSRYTGSFSPPSPDTPPSPDAPTPETADSVVHFNYPGYPEQLINITDEWARYLDPMVESANRSVFDLIMQKHYVVQQSSLNIGAINTFAAQTLVLMVTNGLARIGYESTLQGSPKSIPGTPFIDGNYWLSGKGNIFTVDPVESKDWVKFHVNSTLQGYAYNTQTLPTRLAIVVMTLYCIIALGHVIYSGITGRFLPVSYASDIFPIL